jgi:multidrug resistance efflux pump
LLAGQHVLGIRVRSTTDPAAGYVAELPVTVNSQPVVSLHLDPQTISGGSTAEVGVVARNLGNVPVNLWLQTTDPSNAIQADLGQLEVPIGPDEEATIPLTLTAHRPLLGSGVARPYSIVADIEDRAGEVGAEAQPFVEQVRAEGVFQQSARINGRVLTTLGMLLPIAVILIVAYMFRPQTEPETLSGPLSFGVAGVVDRVEVRPQQFILAGDRIATMRGTEAEFTLSEAQLTLRRAIVDLEGLKTAHLADQAQVALDENAVDPAPEPGFLEGLVQELQVAVESALAVSSAALTGLTSTLNTYCDSVETRPTECDTQPVPLPSGFVAQLVDEAATNSSARDVVDANANYRTSSSTLQTVQALLQDAEARFEAEGGDPEADPNAEGGAEADAEPEATPDPLIAAEDEQAQTEYELSLLEQQAAIAEAQLACRAALQDVGRSILRAPVDVQITEVLVTPGAEVEGDAPIVVVERTDGRVFTPPAGLRAPDPQDLPDSSCPGTIEELHAADDQASARQESASQKSTKE